MEQPEHAWLAEYRRGDAEALGKLVEHYRRPLFGFILSMTERQGDAEEIFQEVWFRAIRHLDRYRPKRFLSWLFKIAHNLVIDRARQGKPVVPLVEMPVEGRPWADRTEARGLDPSEQAGARDLGGRIAAAAARLPPEQKAVFLLRTQAELPFREIARIQGVSINTALARMHYALLKLREALREDYEDLRRGGS